MLACLHFMESSQSVPHRSLLIFFYLQCKDKCPMRLTSGGIWVSVSPAQARRCACHPCDNWKKKARKTDENSGEFTLFISAPVKHGKVSGSTNSVREVRCWSTDEWGKQEKQVKDPIAKKRVRKAGAWTRRSWLDRLCQFVFLFHSSGMPLLRVITCSNPARGICIWKRELLWHQYITGECIRIGVNLTHHKSHRLLLYGFQVLGLNMPKIVIASYILFVRNMKFFEIWN